MILILCTSPLHLLTSISIKRDYYRDKDVSVLLLVHSAHQQELKLISSLTVC